MFKKLLNMFLFIVSCVAIIVIVLSPFSIFHSEKLNNFRIKLAKQNIANTRLFITAWRTSKTVYYDKCMNHQDWNKWKYRYISKIKTTDDAVVAINTMLASLNEPYTKFFDAKKYELQDRYIRDNRDESNKKIHRYIIEYIAQILKINKESNKKLIINKLLKMQTSATIHFETIAGIVTKATVIKQSEYMKNPKLGDEIISINNYKLAGTEINSAINLIRGTDSFLSKIELLRNGKIINISLPRGTLAPEKISCDILDKDILYIKIYTLVGNRTPLNLQNMINQYSKDTKGIIIDLRGDIGGQAVNAIYIADNILNQGQEIISIKYRNGSVINLKAETISQIERDKPIVILVDNRTASASEILAGALKKNKRAILVGEETFGKNAIQQIISMQNSTGMNITTAHYSFDNNFEKGNNAIIPDYEVKLNPFDVIKGKDTQLEKAKEIIKKEIK